MNLLMLIKKPETEIEFNQILKLNYKTFVEEIPQHKPNDDKLLVDKFHAQNQYLIAKRGEQVIGMISYCTERPFSLDYKLENLDNYLPISSKIAEVRLLSVQQENRSGKLAYLIFKALATELMMLGTDLVIISGTTRQLSLYEKVGFVPFGPLVGTKEAAYQPMYITLNQLRSDFRNN